MLGHTCVQRHVVILAPAAERVEQKDRVFISKCKKLLTSVLEEEHVSIMQRVSNLESVNSIGFLFLNLFLDLSRSHSVFVQSIVEANSLCESGDTRDEPVPLGNDSLGLRVVFGPSSESP